MSKTSTAVKARYNEKTYSQYTFSLRKDTDSELIAYIEAQKAQGLSTAQIIRQLYSLAKPAE